MGTGADNKILPGGQQDQEHEVVHQDQGEHLQLLLLHHFQNASNQGIQIQNNYDKWH